MEKTILSSFSLDELTTLFRGEIREALKENSLDNQPKKRIHTRKETKELLKVSYVTLNNWTKSGILPCQRIGGKVYYQIDDILNAMNPNQSKIKS